MYGTKWIRDEMNSGRSERDEMSVGRNEWSPGEWIRSDPITGMILLGPCTSLFGPEVSSYSLFTVSYTMRHAPNSNCLGMGTILFSQVFFLYFRYSFIYVRKYKHIPILQIIKYEIGWVCYLTMWDLVNIKKRHERKESYPYSCGLVSFDIWHKQLGFYACLVSMDVYNREVLP
jgi:hypothetical protein